MCPQVCNGSGSAGDDPRQVLAGWLDDYAADRCGRDDVRAIFISVSRSSTEAPWIALALLDQFQRLDRIDTPLALELKSEINQLVFGAPQPSAGSRLVTPAVKQHHTVHSKPAQRREIVSKPLVVTAQSLVAADNRSDRHDALHAFEHAATATTQVEELQQPQTGSVAAPARRILRQRYELLELISSNPTGTVYRALDRQREHLPYDARYVAVKVVSLDKVNVVASPVDIQQGFYRAQSLAHPNIRSVFDMDHDGDTCFFVMELLHGERLSTLLQHYTRRTIPWHYARNILCGVGAALVYAHDHDVVHGDLQPQNVMITHAGEVKVLEFGFVPVQRTEPWISDGATPATSHSEPPRYSRIGRTDALEPHPSDDLFSLACIAYELLSGRHPYGGHSVSVARAQGHRPARSARFNQHQWQVLQRALLLKRDDRKISIRELLVGLGCAQAPLPLASPATLLAKRTDRPAWLQPTLLTAVSLLAVGSVAYVFAPSLLGKSLQLGGATSLTLPADSVEGVISPTMTAPADAVPVASSNAETPPKSSIDSTSPAIGAATTSSETSISTVSTQMPDTPAALNTKEGNATTTAESVAFSRDSFVVSEGEGAASAVIRRNGRIDTALRVRWSLIGDSATPGEDYADIGAAIAEIPAGEREYTLMIPLAADAVRENTELFTVKLDRADDGPPLLEPSTATVIVVDDD